jgi:hypothetical protein
MDWYIEVINYRVDVLGSYLDKLSEEIFDLFGGVHSYGLIEQEEAQIVNDYLKCEDLNMRG